jgi:glycosyltransferase involved in cell wall biosynthesis
MTDEAMINSTGYWDSRFAKDWDVCQGPAQSRFFARVALQNLPRWLLDQARRESLTICDWGCAQGDGTDVWASYVAARQLTGIDFSSVAVEQARFRYPAISFACDDWLTQSGHVDPTFDLVFSSNTLEHFHEPYEVLDILSRRARKGLILTLPYRELERFDEHLYTFLAANIPLALSNGFRLVWSRVVDCRSLAGTLWQGDQIVLVYVDSGWADGLALKLEDSLLTQNENDTELARLTTLMAEGDAQVASLGQHVQQLELETEQLRRDRDSFATQIEQVLASSSWRITRPLRAAGTLLKIAPTRTSVSETVWRLARGTVRMLPFPLGLKLRVRAALTNLLHTAADGGGHFIQDPINSAITNGVPDSTAQSMRPECCGLEPGLVSVVLPVFNQASLLAESIESVLAQTYQRFELIVVNDGSTDGVEAVLERYLGHPKFRCYTQINQKLPKALSNGFNLALGEYWTWTSADNIMEPTMLDELVAKLRSNPYLGMVYADYYAIDDQGQLLQDGTWRAHNRPNPQSGEIRLPRSVATLNTVPDNFIGPCFMYCGWIGRCIGDYDPQLGIEDYDYWMRINAFFRIEHLGSDDLLYRYRVHDNTLSANAGQHRIQEKVQALMIYESTRSAFYKLSTRYTADQVGSDWLVANGVSPDDISLAAGVAWLALDLTDVLVFGAETIVSDEVPFLRSAKPVVVVFNRPDIQYQGLRRLLNRSNCIALTPDRGTADHVRLLGTCPLLDASSPIAFRGIQTFAKNRLFLSATRTSEELAREVPRIEYGDHDRLCPSDLSWGEFIGRTLSRRGEFRGIFVQEVAIDWNVVLYQRPQHIAAAFGRLGYLVIYRTANSGGDDVDGFREVSLNVWLTNRGEVDEIAGVVRSFYSTYAHAPESLLKNGRRGVLVYEYIGHIDLQIFRETENVQHLAGLKEFSFGGGADYVLASARKLEEEALATVSRGRVLLVQNGVDTRHYRNPVHQQTPLPGNLVAFRRKFSQIVGYYGALAPWLWYEAITDLVAARPDLGFVFLGPDCCGGSQRLPVADNLLYLGAVEYRVLPAYARQFDVCFIPFAPGEIARTTSPLQLFESFALEKPVVVTSDLLECVDFQEVFNGDSVETISDALNRALSVKDDPEFKARLAGLADQNDWNERVRAMEVVFSSQMLRDE